jgi:glucose-1-phosphate cytidylyltransferase
MTMNNTQVVLLAGGLGTRLSEETDRIPKPMVSIGSNPILWHIMKCYAHFGFNDFIICGGYKINAIIEYFVNYRLHTSNLRVDMGTNQVTYLNDAPETWKVTIINTGEQTQTGGRLRRVREHLTPGQPFCMTYGDGLSDVNLAEVFDFHRRRGFEATLTAVRPTARFGSTEITDGRITKFSEKPVSGEGHINGGFFVLNHSVLDLIDGDDTVWERGPLETLAERGTLGAYVHDGFWQPMDTLRERRNLEDIWHSGKAPWKLW